MVFSSMVFLCIFLPAVLVLHIILPGIRAKNAMLLIASLLFYAYGEPVYVLLMIGAALAAWAAALVVRRSRIVLILAVLLELGVLIVFKYAGFLVGLFNDATGAGIPVPQIALPIGISFFTFQALSYVFDVRRGKTPEDRNFFRVLLYISFFPQLIAGPIVQYGDIAQELSMRTVRAEDIHDGMKRFAAGLCKKVLIANTMGLAADTLFGAEMTQVGAASAWIGAVSYLMQIYFDFSGYSDMAIGLGRMFGFHFRENFLYPYSAGSVREFWRRWHISLSGWFKEYLYIPLGGSREGRKRAACNRMLVFLCTGIWHGASLNFLFWGLYHGLLVTAEGLLDRRGMAKSSAFRTAAERSSVLRTAAGHLYTCLAVTIGFVFFRCESLRQGFLWVGRMFGAGGANLVDRSLALTQLTPLYLLTLGVAVIAALPVRSRLVSSEHVGGYAAATDLLSIAGLVLCVLSLSSGAYNPFIYFRF